MEHWLDRVLLLLQADTDNLRELAEIAGGDPRTFYRAINISDVDIKGQNIDGMEFAQSDRIKKADKAHLTILDLSDATVRKLIQYGKRRGFVTFDQINEILPPDIVSPEQIEEIMTMISDMGIDVQEDEAAHFATLTPSEKLVQIKSTAKQEERLALLLGEIARDRSQGLSILDAYSIDRSKFATWALTQIRQQVQQSSPDESALVVAKLISLLYAQAFPFSQGRLLYYLALHLARYPLARQAIRSKLEKTKSMSVEVLRNKIESLLDRSIENPSS